MSFDAETKLLGDLISYKKGFAFKSTDYKDEGVAVIRVSNFVENSISPSDLKYVSKQIANANAAVSLKEHDIIVATVGSWPTNPLSVVGRTISVPAWASGSLMNQNSVTIRAISPHFLDQKFIYYQMKSAAFSSHVISKAQGSANQASITLDAIFSYPLWWPEDKTVRRSAVEILFAIDSRIDLLHETNATLEAIAQASFKSWFVDFDPVRAKSEGKLPEGMDEAAAALFPNSFENSALGEIPKGWEIKNLGQVAYNVKSRIKNAEDWKNLDLLDLSRMPRKILFPFEYGKGKELSTSVFEFKKDDCLFGAVRPYFHKVCHATRNGVTNSSVLVIRSLVPENQFFVNLVASSKECVTHATSYSQGTKMPTINWENLSRFSIVCPPDNLQSIFCEYVSLFFKKAINNSLIINLLTELRDVLLPRLVTGQLKLPNSREINNKTMENH